MTTTPSNSKASASQAAKPGQRASQVAAKSSAVEPRVFELNELVNGQSADTFALLAAKDEAKTKDGKPYFRVTFKDAKRSVVSMIWSDHELFKSCLDWVVGGFFKLRCKYEETSFGPQVSVDRIRAVVDADREQGFDPDRFFEVSRFDRDEMFAELRGLVEQHISERAVQELVLLLLDENANAIKQHAAAARNHHAFVGGYLEHTLSVTRTAVFLADKYAAYYTKMQPPLSKTLVVAGAVLHDIGKMYELEFKDGAWAYTPEGRLVGHILMGRDMVRAAALRVAAIDAETLLRIEHMIISHQNLPEWGSPIAPHTPEALLVHYADDIDAKFHELATELETSWPAGTEFTTRNNPLRRYIFVGLNGSTSARDATDDSGDRRE
ncbi:MAG: HD domain-containing protein [Planctomycetota bacterium]|nr:HD domain-containing protein [Planctomycetota bacterium]